MPEEFLPILPFPAPVSGTVSLPGSKSLTNRALLLAALCPERVTLQNPLHSRDTAIMLEALRRLGFAVEEQRPGAGDITIGGGGGQISAAAAEINVGNAGTAARFLTALLACRPGGVYSLDGDEAMRARPMSGLLTALESCGAAAFTFHGKPGHFPFTLRAQGLPGGEIPLDASASSQILSGLLMVAPLAAAPLTLRLRGGTVSRPFVEMTREIMKDFGGETEEPETDTFTCRPGAYSLPQGAYPVEPDATAASYFLALPLVTGGALQIEGLGTGAMKQGDAAFAGVLREAGLSIEKHRDHWAVTAPAGQTFRGVRSDFNAFSDTFLTLAAIAPLLSGPTRIEGIAHTRRQETDRVAAAAEELRRLGQGVREEHDSLEIEPAPLRPATIRTYEDHRIAMSFGILGCHDLRGDGRPWLTIQDPRCCAKTFPRFFECLQTLRPSPASNKQ